MREAVKKAYYHKDKGIRYHDEFVAESVYYSSDYRRSKEAGNRRNGEEQTHSSGVCAVEEDKDLGTEGEEHLLSGAVEHLKHIVFGIFFAEKEAALVGVGFAFPCYPE